MSPTGSIQKYIEYNVLNGHYTDSIQKYKEYAALYF